jgi:ubiquinone/menaquinone biosynthesis C-methylase UbiE
LLTSSVNTLDGSRSKFIMATPDEINYIANVSKVLNVPLEQFESYLIGKPFSDEHRGWYLMDIAQILKHLPQPPARLLDIGVGSGWTSKIFALSGYDVVGVDIAPSMIELAKRNCHGLANIEFHVCNYEADMNFGSFDCAAIYDALHHSTDEQKVIKNIYNALKKGGLLITIEPGRGHSQTTETLDAIRKYGTTEKDMPFELQKLLMQKAGFSEIKRYYRLSSLPLENVTSKSEINKQIEHFTALSINTHMQGFTSVVVGVK